MARLVKLHRSKNNRVLAGVFGGVAEYLGWSKYVEIFIYTINSINSNSEFMGGNGGLYFFMVFDARGDC